MVETLASGDRSSTIRRKEEVMDLVRMVGLLSCWLLTCGTSETQAQTPPRQPSSRLDAVGVPLPEGALLRLGGDRFQNPATSSVAYSPDGTLLATGCYDMHLRVWDASTGRMRACEFLGWEPDGKP